MKMSYEQLFRMVVYRLNKLRPDLSREECKLKTRMVPPRLLNRFLGKVDWKLRKKARLNARVQLEKIVLDRYCDLGDLQRQSLRETREVQPAQAVDLHTVS